LQVVGYFPVGKGDTFYVVFGQHSAESAKGRLCVWQCTPTPPTSSLLPIGPDYFPTRPLPRIYTGYLPAKLSFIFTPTHL
jgi:hypothetical protein